jgi:hypothetical protein
MESYRRTRLVKVYPDNSELLYLPDDKSYVWVRPETETTKSRRFSEVTILADSDLLAMAEISKAVQAEYVCRMLGGSY